MSEVDLSRYFRVIWKWLWLIVVSMIIAGGTAYRASQFIPPTYRASTTVQVGDDVSNPNLSSDDILKSQRIAGGYATQVTRQPILDATIKELKLPITWLQL